MPVDRAKYRSLAGAFPTGVTIVTTADAAGGPRGLTTQSFVGLSTDPPLMIVSLDKTSRTLLHLRAHKAFVVNFLKAGAEDLASLFASKTEDKFIRTTWRPSAIARGAPILHESSVAFAECIVDREIEAGDHWIFIGTVEGGDVLGGTPLLYYRRTYAAWPEEQPAPQIG